MRIAIQFIYQLIIHLLLPLIGWGFSDLSRLFDHPARALFIVAVVLQALGRALLPPPLRRPVDNKPGEFPVSRTFMPTRLNLISFETILILSPFSDARGIAVINAGDWLRYVGLALYVLGSAWFIWTVYTERIALRDSPPEKERVLVTAGPYRRIRYPRHLGLLVFCLGTALVFRAWAGVFFVPIMLVAIGMGISKEEQDGRKLFGLEWYAYCKRTWKLIPGVY